MSLRKAVPSKAPARSGVKAPAKAAKFPAAAKSLSAKPAPAKPVAAGSATVRIIPAKEDPADAAGGPIGSGEATRLAARIERDLREGRLDTLTPQAFQALMAALCRSYGAQLEAGGNFPPISDRGSVSPTEIMTTTSGLLRAANLAVFELGMWQSWTGR